MAQKHSDGLSLSVSLKVSDFSRIVHFIIILISLPIHQSYGCKTLRNLSAHHGLYQLHLLFSPKLPNSLCGFPPLEQGFKKISSAQIS